MATATRRMPTLRIATPGADQLDTGGVVSPVWIVGFESGLNMFAVSH